MNVKGKTVCMTGVLAGVKRDEAEAGLTALGATVTGSVSKFTDILFVGAQAVSMLRAGSSCWSHPSGNRSPDSARHPPALRNRWPQRP